MTDAMQPVADDNTVLGIPGLESYTCTVVAAVVDPQSETGLRLRSGTFSLHDTDALSAGQNALSGYHYMLEQQDEDIVTIACVSVIKGDVRNELNYIEDENDAEAGDNLEQG